MQSKTACEQIADLVELYEQRDRDIRVEIGSAPSDVSKLQLLANDAYRAEMRLWRDLIEDDDPVPGKIERD